MTYCKADDIQIFKGMLLFLPQTLHLLHYNTCRLEQLHVSLLSKSSSYLIHAINSSREVRGCRSSHYKIRNLSNKKFHSYDEMIMSGQFTDNILPNLSVPTLSTYYINWDTYLPCIAIAKARSCKNVKNLVRVPPDCFRLSLLSAVISLGILSSATTASWVPPSLMFASIESSVA